MRLGTVFKVLRDLLGILLISIGSLLVAADILILLARIATIHGEPPAPGAWWPLFVGLGVSSTIMLVGGILLVRSARRG